MWWREVAEAAKAQGWRYVATAGGLVPLDQWTPYGGAGDVNRYVSFSIEAGAIVEEARPPFGQFVVMGRWPLHRESDTVLRHLPIQHREEVAL